jgi:metal-responsive CopG/Arc/MetJ family transcriptional regulator
MLTKKVLLILPASMLVEIDHISEAEHRTRSDLVREMARRYIEDFRRKQNVLGVAREVSPRLVEGY